MPRIFFSRDEALESLGIDSSTLDNYTHDGKLGELSYNGEVLYPIEEIDKLARQIQFERQLASAEPVTEEELAKLEKEGVDREQVLLVNVLPPWFTTRGDAADRVRTLMQTGFPSILHVLKVQLGKMAPASGLTVEALRLRVLSEVLVMLSRHLS